LPGELHEAVGFKKEWNVEFLFFFNYFTTCF
jgi:hypothetical protein